MKLRTLFGGNKTAQELASQIAEVPADTNIMVTKLPLDVFYALPFETSQVLSWGGNYRKSRGTRGTRLGR